ncbi:MAG: asparagine synthase (glutamine-hydrolyzing) [Rhodospirillaceae bacterium]
MCGIAGLVGREPVNVAAVEAMAERIAHRGPDDAGVWSSADGRAAFGHRRLAIIDPTPAGHQPMASPDGSLVITYNGEIYNYVELAKRLEAEGQVFRTGSDTEVLLAVYERWGTAGFRELNGMFAFAIHDGRAGMLVCARDRFGEKPFLYAEGAGFLAFASEYKALLALDGVSSEIDTGRLLSFLRLPRQGLDDVRQSLFAGVSQLLPGETMSVDLATLETRVSRYWDLAPDPDAGRLSDDDVVERFAELLKDAVAIRMRSDVPVGSCLSGGLDSSSIVCLNRLHLGQDIPYHVFTGRFPGSGADEWAYAEQVVHAARVESHVTEPKPDRLAAELDTFMWMNELPVGSSSQYAQWCVFRLAKEAGVTVLLDGQGADEVLGGYEQYFRNYIRSLVQAGQALAAFEEEPLIRKRYPLALADKVEVLKLRAPFALKRMLAYLLDRGSDFRFGLSGDAMASLHQAPENESPLTLHEALREDAFHAHLPTLLRYGDRNSMAHSREVRLPFCDHRLAEFAFALAPGQLMGGVETKRLLRRAMKDVLPEGVRTRWNKQGFLPPQERWFADGLLATARDMVESDAFRSRGYWDAGWWRRVVARLEKGEGHLAWVLWKPVNAEAWHRHFLDAVRKGPRLAVFKGAAA